MHTLSMIDASSKVYEAIAPIKSAEPKREEFNRVLDKRQEPRAERQEQPKQAERAEQPKQAERAEQPKQAERAEQPKQAEKAEQPKQAEKAEQPKQTEKAEQPKQTEKAEQQPVREVKHACQNECVEQTDGQATSVAQTEGRSELQDQLMDLLKMIADGEAPEAIEEQLAGLVQQLESSDLQGEQVLSGIDLSALVDLLQIVSTNESGEEQLTQLVAELQAELNSELNSEIDPLDHSEQVATIVLGTDPQMTSQPLPENLAKARQLLQKAINSVTKQDVAVSQAVVEVEEEAVDPKLLKNAVAEENIDPRFASLLKPRNLDQESLRQRVQGDNVKPETAQAKAPVIGETTPVEVVSAEKTVEDIAQLLGGKSPQQRTENFAQQIHGNAQQQATQTVAGRTLPTAAPVVQLPSGQQVAESQIFDQVVTRMSGSFNGESGKMVLRLQPAELGSLRLELTVEGDKVRASLLAQTQQVQEVLERNLPQLRNALAEQGLKIDQFQVDVEQKQEQGQFEQHAQQQKEGQQQKQPVWQPNLQPDEQIIPLAHLMQNGGGGISLRV